jgi:hypothetical protein
MEREFNMKDPKLGYHWIWMLPVWLMCEAYFKVCDLCRYVYYQINIKLIYKRNPEIKELTKLSGIKK